MKKEIRVIRGLPGCGKSSLAQKMKVEEGAVVYNNDELMTVNGLYKWDEDNALLAHWMNQRLAAEAMRQGVPLLVIDNTNLLPYYASPYVRLGKYYGYSYSIIQIDTPWCLDVDELERRNSHCVPKSVIKEMKETMLSLPTESLDVILAQEMAMDPEATLRLAQTLIEEDRFIQTDECMVDYESWRHIGGYEPEAGSDVVASINDKLALWRDSCGAYS